MKDAEIEKVVYDIKKFLVTNVFKDKKNFVLGTAQLGSNYGITNSKQKVSKKESFKILDLAWEKGIRYFDTAPTYNSQKIIGEYIKVNKIEKEIKVFSKISSLNNNKNITKNIKLALEKNIYDLNVLPVINFIHDRKNISFFKKFINISKVNKQI